MRYKIVATGDNKEALTWARDYNTMNDTIERLKSDGYTEFNITMEFENGE